MKGTQGFPFKVTGYPKRENREKNARTKELKGHGFRLKPSPYG